MNSHLKMPNEDWKEQCESLFYQELSKGTAVKTNQDQEEFDTLLCK